MLLIKFMTQEENIDFKNEARILTEKINELVAFAIKQAEKIAGEKLSIGDFVTLIKITNEYMSDEFRREFEKYYSNKN